MALNKESVKYNFAQGIDSKLDKWQLPAGKFEILNNSNFNTVGQLEKRNGYAQIGTLGSFNYSQVATLNGNLIVSGDNIASYSSSLQTYQTTGKQLTSTLSTLSLVKDTSNTFNADSQSANGLTCVAWSESNSILIAAYYKICDSITGQTVVAPVLLNSATTNYTPRVFVLGTNFIVTFTNITNLLYVAIPISNPFSPSAHTNLNSNILADKTSYDAQVSNGVLYFAYRATSSNTLFIFNLNSSLTKSSEVATATVTTSVISVVPDPALNGNIFYLFVKTPISNPTLHYQVYSSTQALVLAATQVSTTFITPWSATGVIKSGIITIFCESPATYVNGSSQTLGPNWANGGTGTVASGNVPQTNVILTAIATNAAVITGIGPLQLGVGLASKAFLYNGTGYFLIAYGVSNTLNLQPSFFLLDDGANIIGKLSYGNGAGYSSQTTAGVTNAVLSNPTVQGNNIYLCYITAFAEVSVNKSGIGNTVGIFESLGINQVEFNFHNTSGSVEAAGCLSISGTILNQYDQLTLTEADFCVWPDDLWGAPTATSGSYPADTLQYWATYEWTDNQGIVHRSAPSAPIVVTTDGTKTGVQLYIPTLRLTNKSFVRIVIYRQSTTQAGAGVPYQITSVRVPALNDKTINQIAYVDTALNTAVIGNNILYTNGGVVEDIQAPPCFDPILYHDRVWITDAENTSLLWYTKQIIEDTPLEFSDLFTYFVPPTKLGTSGIFCKAVMDDKLILFKSGTILYVTGQGPDNTGANNDLSDPTEIVTPVGCINRNSICTIPSGIIFQASDSGGIWLLNRSLGVSYIGSPVQLYNSNNILSALLIPGTNQVRVHLDNNVILMYDFFIDQWGTFTRSDSNFGTSAIIYNGLHTYLDNSLQIEQETPGIYLDLANPVLMNFTTAWIAVAGLQGYQRSFAIYLLAKYLSAHNLLIQIAYDFNSTPTQSTTINPNGANLTPMPGQPDGWRVFLTKERCQSFQITMQEVYTGTPGAALTLSGLNILAAFKSAWRTISSAKSVGKS